MAGRWGLSMQSKLPADVGHLDFFQLRGLAGTDLRVTVVPTGPDRRNLVLDIAVGRATAQQGAHIVTGSSKQAGEQLALGGEAYARAVAAESLGDRGDHADFTAAVLVAPAFRDLSRVVGG